MMHILPVLQKDFYKADHKRQYPDDTILIYSNETPRGTRRENGGLGGVIACGFQYFVLDFLIEQFNTLFFNKPKDEVLKEYQETMDDALGPGMDISHIGELHDLGYLPLKVKAVPEGTFVPYRIPVMTIRNTKPEFFWLTNMLETILSNMGWKIQTSATTAFAMRKEFVKFARLTGQEEMIDFTKWQGHDFSMRGMSGLEDACLSASGHAFCFFGSDTVPVIPFLKRYYGAKGFVVGSVPATEHSVMCMGLKMGEWETLDRLLFEVYPNASVLSIVCDTWDFWRVITEYIPSRKERILARPGKFVIRPDSGDPVKLTTGDPEASTQHERDGLTLALYKLLPGPTNEAGFKTLDPHIEWIYGDSITPSRQRQILQNLYDQGFVSTIPVLGVGSFTYEYVTRDTDGFAMKATYGETKSQGALEIFKAPKTDNGTKNSAKGLLAVLRDEHGGLYLKESCSAAEEATGILQTIFEDGKAYNLTTLDEIRARIEAQLG